MANFGGNAYFGGDCEFGSGDPRLVRYHRALIGLDPPGVWNEEDDAIHYDLLKSYACALGSHGQLVVDRLFREIFPHTAEENLAEWEKLYKVSKQSTDTVAQRQSRLIARWRENLLSTLPHLRMILDRYLNSTTAFWDRFDDADVSFRLEQSAGNGTIAETTYLQLTCPAADCSWTTSTNNAPTVYTQLNDYVDDCYAQVEINTISDSAGCGFGIMLYKDDSNMIGLEVYEDGGNYDVRWIKIVGGIRTASADLVTGISTTYYLQIHKDVSAGKYYFSYGSDSTNLTTSGTSANIVDIQFVPTYAGLYKFNSASGTGYYRVNDFKFWHGESYNNIEIIETPVSIVDATNNPEHIFFAFVHREPTDTGSYTTVEAQAAMNRAKQAHTVIAVGESDCFRCDDSYSLTDRDVLGQ